MIWDTFMLYDELDVLECRLRELEGIPDIQHVIVESEVAHRGFEKPLWYAENQRRFAPWSNRIVHVVVRGGELPSLQDEPDPWAREFAQREFVRRGLADAGAGSSDFLLHGDCDEIPDPRVLMRSLRAGESAAPAAAIPSVLQMRLCQYAADWVHPLPWQGTIITRVRNAGRLAELRGLRNSLPRISSGGTHLSWMGGTPAHVRKLDVHCHLEMTKETETALASGQWLREGRHSDGFSLTASDVDETWPAWVWKRECPESWFRPRKGEGEGEGE